MLKKIKQIKEGMPIAGRIRALFEWVTTVKLWVELKNIPMLSYIKLDL